MDPLRPLFARLRFLGHPRFKSIRALLVLLHAFAVVVVACPAPIKGANRKQWERPGIRSEVRSWQKRFRAVGIDATEEEIVDFAVTATKKWSSARNDAIAPFQWYLRKVGAPQGWYMFTAPDRLPMRFKLERVGADDAREQVFLLGKSVDRPDLVEPAFLDEHRVRRALFQTAWSERESVHKEVCAWFGRRVLEKEPDTKEVICSQIEFQVEHPWTEQKAYPEKQKKILRLSPDDLSIKQKRKKKAHT